MADPAVLAEGLVKRYGRLTALDHLDLACPAGTVTAVLGPNGAGKTTTVRILATLLRPDAGRAVVAGADVAADPWTVRRRIGLSGQYAAVDEYLTGAENLEMFGRLHHLGGRAARARAAELLARFRLDDAAARPVRGYSGGMRRRLDLAAALVSHPSVLFLDEPTTGLDPRSRNDMWQVISELVAAGTTVLLTTQYLEEADRLADAVVVVDHGRVIARGTSDDLKARVGGEVIELQAAEGADPGPVAAALRAGTGADPVPGDRPGTLQAPVTGRPAAAVLVEVLTALGAAGVPLLDVAVRRPTLDDVFLTLTGAPPEAPGGGTDPSDGRGRVA